MTTLTTLSSLRWPLRIAFAALVVSLSAPASAEDQNGDEKKTLKKAAPLLNRRSLAIPKRLPSVQRAKSNPAFKQRAKQTAPKQRTVNPAQVKQKPSGNQRVQQPRPAPKRPRPTARRPGRGKGKSTAAFANLTRAGGKQCRPLPSTARVNFDFKGDIKELVETVSKTTCKNFILTNKVRSQKFEIVSPTPITVNQAWRAFLSALEANDFSLIQVGRYYKVIQSTQGTRSPVPLYKEGSPPVEDRMITVVWNLEHATDINAVVNYLNIFKSGKGQIHPFAATNTVIATDYGTSIQRLESILQEIDRPGIVEDVRVVSIQFASASDVAEKLTQIFEPAKAPARGNKAAKPRVKVNEKKKTKRKTKKAAPDGGNEAPVQVSKILADDRTNKLIIICTHEAFLQIKLLLRELDVPESTEGQRIHVISLKHADAEELAQTLSSLAQGGAGGGRGGRLRQPNNRRGNNNNNNRRPAGGASAALFEGDVKITADKATNSLVVTASKGDLSSVRRVIEKLDVPRFQVFVEAVILEVSISRDRTLGVGWHGGIAPVIDGEETPIIFSNTPNQELSSLAAAANPLNLASLLGLAGAIRGPTLAGTESIVTGGIPAIGVILQALQSTNDVNVVSTPHLLTVDNEEAEIQVNEKRPFPSGLSLGGNLAGLAGANNQAAQALGNLGGLGLGQVSFNREDVGLTLKLKPQINDEDYVRLEIDQELSDVAGIDQVTNQVITSKRSAKTTVVVRSQDSVVIGGLVRDRETVDEAKTPLLGDLPLIGWLFKRQQRVVEKTNLLLILTPYIIRGPSDFQRIFERKMAERKEFVDRFYGTTSEYRASIDWDRKVGPLGSYHFRMTKELRKIENDGPGQEGEQLIKPGSMPEPDEPPAPDLPPEASPAGNQGER